MTSDLSVLADLRREIDRIDDALHDLLMRRTEVVEKIGLAKRSNVFLAPGREARVLRRLVARHGGRFPRATVVRLWREMFGALVGVQGPFAIAVYMPQRGAGYMELARDQYGSYTPSTSYTSVSQVLRAVSDGSATVGILPLPEEDDVHPWWHSIVADSPDTPRIIARLPFVGPGPGRGDGLQAVVIGRIPPEPSDWDNTYLVVETSQPVSRASLRRHLGDVGLDNTNYLATHAVSGVVNNHLLEVPGFISRDDSRLQHLRSIDGAHVSHTLVLGAYALPFAPSELDG